MNATRPDDPREANLPNELKALTQWVCAGSDKAPVDAKTGRSASVTDPTTWSSFDVALRAGHPHIGFVLTEDDTYSFIDLDKPRTAEQAEGHRRILDAFESYAETSQSGEGVHIVCRGRVPRGARRDQVEVYSDRRYMICTGNVIRDLPVADCQDQLDILFSKMGGSSSNGAATLTEVGEVLTDEEIIELASDASNAHKFLKLVDGEWEGDYPSQSEADFALVNMLCFYSRSNQQCRRLFRSSGLGQRAKAQRDDYLDGMISKIRAEEAPRMDLSSLITAGPGPRSATVVPADVPVLTPPAPVPEALGNEAGTGDGTTYAPGLVGDLARDIYGSSHRPVLEYSMASALGLVAGVVGRQFNVNGTGLNVYLMVTGTTGTGKEAVRNGIDRMVEAVTRKVPAVVDYIGPATFASGQAIVRRLDSQPCFVSVQGEFGLTLQTLCDPKANKNDIVMRRVLLDLYIKSGRASVLYPTAYSDPQKNTKSVASPAVTLIGESTPESFFDGISRAEVAQGLIPRFVIIEYLGDRVDANPDTRSAPAPRLVQRLADLVECVLRMRASNTVRDVELSPAAAVLLSDFDVYCDERIRAGDGDVVRQVWSRAHLNALRIAAILAAASNPQSPVVSEEEAAWALSLVKRCASRLERRFMEGDVGGGPGKQLADIRRILGEYFKKPISKLRSYGVKQVLHSSRLS